MSYTSNTSVMFYVTETGNVSFKVCLFMLGIWFCCLFKITWLHSEDFVTPSWHHWKKMLLFSDFYLFSFTNACLMWLFFGICYIVSNNRLRGLLRLVVCVLFVVVVVVFVDLFVPVLKPLLLHGKCRCSPWGYNIYLSIFPQNVLYTVVPICNHVSDWFYLHYHVCMLWLVAEWQGPVWFVLLWWNEILLMC